MNHFGKKKSKLFFLEGLGKNVWGPSENVSPGPAVALDGPAVTFFRECDIPCQMLVFFICFVIHLTEVTLIEQLTIEMLSTIAINRMINC